MCRFGAKKDVYNMQWTSLNDLREKYLSFFESKGHLRLPSFPLVPQGDKSLLLINSMKCSLHNISASSITQIIKKINKYYTKSLDITEK